MGWGRRENGVGARECREHPWLPRLSRKQPVSGQVCERSLLPAVPGGNAALKPKEMQEVPHTDAHRR